jgi:glycerophosphoryl diester phosphodiesterase
MRAILIFLSFFIGMYISAQTKEPVVMLDRYTISSNDNTATIQCFNCNETKQPAYKLKKGSRWFRIANNNELVLKNNKQTQSSYAIEIQAKIGKRKLKNKFVLLMDSFAHNKVIAHRGAWKNFNVPENSLASLQASFDLGCEGSEFDVHLSADSVVFIHHDANKGNVLIEKTNAADLRKVILSNGEPLPLLTDYLERGMKQHTTKLVLELKPSVISQERSLALARKVMDEVRKARAEAWMIYISFDYAVLQEILKIDPFAKCAYLKGDITPEKLAADKMYGLDYNSANLQKNKDWIPKARELGLTTNVWTVNDSALMDHFLKEGIDLITTNEPELALQKTSASKK